MYKLFTRHNNSNKSIFFASHPLHRQQHMMSWFFPTCRHMVRCSFISLLKHVGWGGLHVIVGVMLFWYYCLDTNYFSLHQPTFVVQYPSRILPNKLVFLDWFCCVVHRSSSRCLYEIGWMSFVISWWLLAICYCIISQSFLLLCLGDGWMDAGGSGVATLL